MRLQVILSLLSTYFTNLDFGLGPSSSTGLQSLLNADRGDVTVNKSIVIVGAGSGGLAMLKALTELPDETRRSLQFVLLEEREDVGGIWLPNDHTSHPPELPKTPLYPRLRTNSPIPSMTYPNFTFPPGTSLFPHYTHILSYHQRFATHHNLYPHIAFKHKVLEARWIGTAEEGQWNLTVLNAKGVNETRLIDHLVVATGNNHIPNVPTWAGQDVWLRNDRKREIVHSIYYRYPDRYANQTVLVIGGGFSGRDTSEQISKVAKKVYNSLRSPPLLELPPGIERKPDISYFTNNTIVFEDNSEVEVDSVLLGTGYQSRKPFLEAGNAMQVTTRNHSLRLDDGISESTSLLQTNLKYVFPLYRHLFSICTSYPPTALSFIGVATGIIPFCHLEYAQSLFITNLILNSSLVPTRKEMLAHLAAEEKNVRDNGLDPYVVGHKLLNGFTGPNDYQDELIDYLKEKGAISSSTSKYVEPWRREVGTYFYLRRGWARIEELGEEDKWLHGVETEEQWADLMRRVNAWQRDWENANSISFVHENYDYVGDWVI